MQHATPARSWLPYADRLVMMAVTDLPGTRRAKARDLGCAPDSLRHDAIPPRFLRTFPGRPEEVAAARRFVTDALAGCPAASDVVLLTSELATNAIQHSATGHGGSFVIAISHGPGRVRVTVTDEGSASQPVVGAGDELSTSGRGLILVDFLAVRWGYAGQRDTGEPGRGEAADGWDKGTVWFELDCSR
jgi:anti-sigma regulatory factor (Ser/Thr protein kinase)